MSEPFDTNGYSLRLIEAPPVYAPGGPVCFLPALQDDTTGEILAEVESDVRRRGGVLMIVQCVVEKPQGEALLLSCGYNYASSWYVGPTTSGKPEAETSLALRTALASDVQRMLEIGERKRYQYEGFSPVFWKVAPAPRETFAPYVTSQVESETNVALVCEENGNMRGYLIAQCRNPEDGYVDDYAIADEAIDWPGSGRALLAEAARRAHERGVTAFTIVSGHADIPKRAAIESLGFTLRKNWLVKPLQ